MVGYRVFRNCTELSKLWSPFVWVYIIVDRTKGTQNISREWSMTCQQPYEWEYSTLANVKDTKARVTSKNQVKRERTQLLR